MMDKPPTKEQKACALMLENRRWFDEHFDEIHPQYKGKVIAVHSGRVVASASSSQELLKAIEGKYDEEETFIILVPLEPVFVIPYPQ